MKCIEFYSGICGLHIALKGSRIPNAQLIKAYDWDQSACQVYTTNHGPSIVSRTDISRLTAGELAALGVDIWLALLPVDHGPESESEPREARSTRGHKVPFTTSMMCFRFHDSATRTHLVDALARLGYTTAEFFLAPVQFGILNSLLRY
ncbi:hypothetical protein CONPUDRAFT_148330 [Coniophora puteana RWD-64-598 SS2]|uniref:S-adenosyl-L-methionine-dependent methyltransferase n=1 Tax=Coniophora puteana (strain RWD-64-598) TaxID=741705 RepID=A0A5M3N4R0_CONPW|nr:uncharacterized protein CONPUDRAFT_148330 [Coniophora puteana RWD-64-598 SS2]EIW86237.1 hypothetical protein CONPUDRAFT_148330 [Coniophora puteana RWD-64-598 SS2]